MRARKEFSGAYTRRRRMIIVGPWGRSRDRCPSDRGVGQSPAVPYPAGLPDTRGQHRGPAVRGRRRGAGAHRGSVGHGAGRTVVAQRHVRAAAPPSASLITPDATPRCSLWTSGRRMSVDVQTIAAVCRARPRGLVSTTNGTSSPSSPARSRPAACACCSPFRVSGESSCPCWRPMRFHSVCPWRTR